MKKIYMEPEMIAVKLNMGYSIMAGSLEQKTDDASVDGEGYYENQLGRESDYDFSE